MDANGTGPKQHGSSGRKVKAGMEKRISTVTILIYSLLNTLLYKWNRVIDFSRFCSFHEWKRPYIYFHFFLPFLKNHRFHR